MTDEVAQRLVVVVAEQVEREVAEPIEWLQIT
jgi:hypothetical protein